MCSTVFSVICTTSVILLLDINGIQMVFVYHRMGSPFVTPNYYSLYLNTSKIKNWWGILISNIISTICVQISNSMLLFDSAV